LALGLLNDLREVLQCALPPTLLALWHTPALVFSPVTISRLFMAHVWNAAGNAIDEGGRDTKMNLLPGNAYGVVLDLGAGHGHTVNYLDREKVSKYIALEPNTLMHPEIRKLANAKDFTESDGSLLILSCGAEDTYSVLAAMGGPNSADTLISILSLCTIPEPERSLGGLVRYVLKPGGSLLFYEHVLSPRDDVAWWQRFWTPLQKLGFGGCRLDRPTHVWIERMGVWSAGDVWRKEGEDQESLFVHRVGKFVKS